MRRVLILVAIVAVVGLLAWWLLRRSAPPPVSAPPVAAAPEAPRSDSLPASRAASPKIVPASLAEAKSESPDSRAARLAMISGRCVDAASGAPLPGCTATLRGNGRERWTSPDPETTGADGRFEIRFDPPKPYAFFLNLDAAGRASMMGRFPNLEPASVTDLGDVAMQSATAMQGRVVDEGGTPQAKVSVIFALEGGIPGPRGKVGPQAYLELTSEADGKLDFRAPLCAGTWKLKLRPVFELVGPASFEIKEGEAERFLEVKVRAPDAGDLIVGVVRDEQGNPVKNADIEYDPQGFDSRGMSWLINTDKDGAFRIQRVNQDRTAPVTITASRAGYEKSEKVRTSWGAKEVVLVVRRGLTVQVVVRDGDENKPLESYGVRCLQVAGTSPRLDPDPTRIRHPGAHPGGVVEVAGVCRGRHRLMVEPEGSAWAGSAFHEFEMTDVGAPRQEVTVWRTVTKTIRVRTKDGVPVAVAHVELLRPYDAEPVDEATKGVSLRQLGVPVGRMAQGLSEGATGVAGTLEVAAPSHERLVLRVTSSGHVPMIRDVDFASSDPIIDFVVSPGATLTGRIVPVELASQLDTREQDEDTPGRRQGGAGAFLRRPGPFPQVEYPLGDLKVLWGSAAAPIDGEGVFKIDGVPAGSWEVHLRYSESMGSGASVVGTHAIGTVELVDGEERKQTFELGYLLKGEVEGVATLDGKPLAEGTVAFPGRMIGPDGKSKPVPSTQNRPIQPFGRFTAALWPGEYRMIAQFQREGQPQAMPDVNLIKVSPGAKLKVNLDLRSSLLKLRLLASDGKTPVGGIEVQAAVPDSDWPASAKTDSQGLVEFRGLPALGVSVRVWKKQYATFEARQADKSLKNQQDALIDVKTILITPPETTATIVLPQSTGY